jgi:mannitol/fructose-specific phosphotransferase system IIA component (Ntr-type)
MDEVQAGFVPVAAGAALPHLRVPGLEHPELLLARVKGGLRPPRGEDEVLPGTREEIRAVFFLISPEEEPGQHLRLLGHLATHVDDPAFPDLWMAAGDPLELRETLTREERSLTVWVRPNHPTGDWIGREIRDIDMGADTLVALVRRNGSGHVPNGNTVIQADDRLLIIGTPASIGKLAESLGRSRGGD